MIFVRFSKSDKPFMEYKINVIVIYKTEISLLNFNTVKPMNK